MINSLEERIHKLEQRNQRVEIDKAWETSWCRKIIVAILTYLTIMLFFIFANIPNPLINSIVPTLGFLLSTLSLTFLKKLWVKFKSKTLQ